MKMNCLMACALSWLLGAVAAPALGMDRWAALSMIESGNNDAAIGRAGEVSRYQILPRLWQKYGGPGSRFARTNPRIALGVARAIMSGRCADFARQFHRAPTDFEYYVLWNAPAQIYLPGPVVANRAKRFCRLVGPFPE